MRNKTLFFTALACACVIALGLTSCGADTKNDNEATDKANGLTSEPADGKINGHDYVDLGLSVKWATCNVGASSPEELGDYFAWGETSAKASYDEDNCPTYNVSVDSIAGNTKYDAAHANWGGTWRLPTAEEINELKSKCKRAWTTVNGVKGYKVTGPNGNSIFLPGAGYLEGKTLKGDGGYGYYWSDTPHEGDTQYAYDLYFNSGSFFRGRTFRYYGQSVRPVSD